MNFHIVKHLLFRAAAGGLAGGLLLAGALPGATTFARAAEIYDMGKSVQRALEANQSLRAAEEASKAAESGRKSSRGSFGPSLSTEYNYTHVDNDSISTMRTNKANTYAWSAGVTQPLFTGFNLLSTYQKAALQAEYTKAMERDTSISLTNTVQETFLSVLSARENVRSAQDSLERLKTQLEVTQAFYDVGLKPRLDVLQAEVDVSDAERQLIVAQNDLETQQVRMNTLLSLPIDADVEYVGSLKQIPFDGTLEPCLATAYSSRPDIYMAGKSVEMAQKDKMIAASEFYPQLNANVTYSQTGDSMKAYGGSRMDGKPRSWSVGVGAKWNLFQWGKDYYNVESADFLINKVRAEEENLRQEVAYDIMSKLLMIQNARKRIALGQKGLAQAREAYRMAVARYQAQVGTNLDVLTAQDKLTLAEATLTSAQADYLVALSRIYAAMGQLNPTLMIGKQIQEGTK